MVWEKMVGAGKVLVGPLKNPMESKATTARGKSLGVRQKQQQKRHGQQPKQRGVLPEMR